MPASSELPAPAALDTTALAMLGCSPSATLLVGADGRVAWHNPAFRALLGPAAAGRALAEVLNLAPPAAQALGVALQREEAALQVQTQRPDAPRWLQVDVRGLPDGRRMVVFGAIDALKAAQAECTRMTELLELAQDFGRLGVWERDVRTLQGRWDRHVNAFWGLEAEVPTPDLPSTMGFVVEDDRPGLMATYERSFRQAGTYEHRFRVQAADGSVRSLHSGWTVRNGTDGRPERVLGVTMDDTQAWSLAQLNGEMASQLGLAVDLAGLAVWRHDLGSGRVHFSAQAFVILGLAPRPEGIAIEEVRALIHPDDLPAVLASTEAALSSGNPADHEVRFRRDDGLWRTLLLRRVVQRDVAGRPTAVLGVALDVTGRIDESRRLAELARRLDLATRTSGLGYWSLEGRTPRAVWSEQLRAIHGLAADAPVPTLPEWLQNFVHPDDRDDAQRRFADWVKSGRNNLETDVRIVRTDGEVRELVTHSRVESRGRHPLLFGVAIDVTERRSNALALQQAAQRAALVARGAGLGTWEVNMQDDSAYWDEQMWRLRGLEPQAEPPSAEGRMAMVHPDDRAFVRRKMEEAIQRDQTANYEFRVVLPDGRVRWLASRSTTIHDAHGNAVRRIGVNWDVTDTRTAEAVRQEREIALRESQAKSKFLARMSHELRTPLNAVLGFTQLLLREPAQDGGAPRRRQHLAVIESAGQHLLSLIDDVLDLTSLEGGELQVAMAPVPLAPLVADLLPLLEPLRSERRVRLQTDALDVLPMADARRLRQVLLNLLGNAIKYNVDGGQVRLSAAPEGREIVLRVEDSGRGMSDLQVRHLFEPFNRLGIEREGIQGTGIGLVIVKSLVERMGGSIHVRSTVGEGSVFEVRLADAATPPEPAVPAAGGDKPEAGMPAGHRGTLLYVEDNAVNALIVSELVARRPGLTLHIATDGSSGVEKALALRPDLILLDMQLPDFDGHEVLRRLRADTRTAHIPCIAVSANAMPDDIERALQAGISDYWTKPIDFRAFMASIDALFAPRV